MNPHGMLRPALIGGVLLGILSVVPGVSLLNCFCCAWVIAGGILAANLYVKSSPTIVTLGEGATLGVLTGVIGAVVDTLFSIPLQFVLTGIGMGIAEQMREALERVSEIPQESRDAILAILGEGRGIGGMLFVFGSIMKLFLYGVMATLGGTIGVALFEKRKGDGTPPPVPPPPAPSDWQAQPPPDIPRE